MSCYWYILLFSSYLHILLKRAHNYAFICLPGPARQHRLDESDLFACHVLYKNMFI